MRTEVSPRKSLQLRNFELEKGARERCFWLLVFGGLSGCCSLFRKHRTDLLVKCSCIRMPMDIDGVEHRQV